MSHQQKILFHLPISNPPDALNGTNGRVLGMLKYFHDRRDRFAVDAIAGNKFGVPEWNDDRQLDVLKFVDNIFVYRGESNWSDFVYTRAQSFYHQRLLRQQLPVDSDYFAPPGYVSYLTKLLAQRSYDFIWINNLDYAHLASDLRSPKLQTVIDIHDITTRFRLVRKKIDFSKNLKFDYQANFEREIALLDRFDNVIVDSQFERNILAKELSPAKLHFIPSQVNGLDSGSNSTPYLARRFEYDVLFVGSDNQPNREGMQFFLDEVLPLIVEQKPALKVAIAGKISSVVRVEPVLAKNLMCLGYVPDLSELYLKSRLVICPLRTGAGTKFKLVEAMAYAMPIVATIHSASALSLVDRVNAFITDDPVAYADRVLRLIHEPELAARCSVQISQTYASQHESAAIYTKLDAIFEADLVKTAV
ncbi:glycosyltransferase [Chamaesiphon sp. GL140_3_metabinner_50]|uniref:glycosyltransferase n=1 Tax=Chamaesiphon sp. GL140_3_metabinner_50 TaxID=2970812 RepID=UPI0025D81793|nr:glycosyltransferase [Chamaesiphon sp. GL140_3_metabinner_50]